MHVDLIEFEQHAYAYKKLTQGIKATQNKDKKHYHLNQNQNKPKKTDKQT